MFCQGHYILNVGPQKLFGRIIYCHFDQNTQNVLLDHISKDFRFLIFSKTMKWLILLPQPSSLIRFDRERI